VDVSQKRTIKKFNVSNCSGWFKLEEVGTLKSTLFQQRLPLQGVQHTLEFNDKIDAKTGKVTQASEVSLKVSLDAKQYIHK